MQSSRNNVMKMVYLKMIDHAIWYEEDLSS